MASGGVDVAVPGDSLGDVRWHAVQHGVGDENLWKSWGVNRSGRPLGSVTPVPLSARVIQSRSVPPGMGAVLETEPALEQQGHGRVPHPFVGVVGRDTTQRPLSPRTGPMIAARTSASSGLITNSRFGIRFRRRDVQQRNGFTGAG